MGPQESVLGMVVRLVDDIPLPPPPPPRPRGHPRVYSDRLFLTALVILIVRRLASAHELRSVLAAPPPALQTLRALLREQGRSPSRRTFARRRAALPATLPAQLGCRGRHRVAVREPWRADARAAASDRTVLRARGGVWPQKERLAGVVPQSALATAARWTKSGWHGWAYGWTLRRVCAGGAVWIPLAALLTPAAEADNSPAPALIRAWPLDLRFLLGAQHCRAPDPEGLGARRGRVLVTPRGGPYPHTAAGVEVRRLLHTTRAVTIANFTEQCKGIFDGHAPVPTRGLIATQRLAWGAIVVYQLSLLYRYQQGADLRVGLKAFLRAA